MKAPMATALALFAAATSAAGNAVSPIGKVLEMLGDLEKKIIAEGEVVQKEYSTFSEWCEDRSRDLAHEIKTGQAEVESLKAAIAEQVSAKSSLETRVEELAAGIATDDSDLKAATEIRTKERADFEAEEKELMETIDILRRATAVLERELKKGGAAMVQLANAGNLAKALEVMVEASMIGSSDASRLGAFVQEAQKSEEQEFQEALDAPAAAAYESKSGGIVEVLQDLQEKAEAQLDDSRKKEVTAAHNFAMLEQSLQDEIKFAQKDMDEAKKSIAVADEKRSAAEGELQTTSKDLTADTEARGSLHHDCLSRAQSFEAETTSRGEELKVLAEAKKIIEEATSASLAQSAPSFIQASSRSMLSSRADLKRFEAVHLVRDLARKHHSAALSQLASRISVVMRRGGGGEDIFAKVKGLITGMISKLEEQATAETTKKQYCDKELAETNAKKADKSDEIEGQSTKIEQNSAKSAKLKEEVAQLQQELAALAKSQAEMDGMRSTEKENFADEKAELEKGLEGLRMAISVLKEYYAKAEGDSHGKDAGTASGIISLLEVAESDFSKNLVEITAEEESAIAEYERVSKENEIEKITKDQDVKYKTKSFKQHDKTAAELNADRSGVQAELDAVLEYLSQLEAECTVKAETYEDRKAAREAEIAGLKEALQTLENETALIQRRRSSVRRHGALRGGAMQA